MELHDLNRPEVRKYMIEEIDADIADGRLYISPRLSPAGVAGYPALLREALATGTPLTLANALRQPGVLNATETQQTKKGPIVKRVPVNAAETLANGEFNWFYARGVCRYAVAAVVEEVEARVQVYRAAPVNVPRPESEAKLGSLVDSSQLLKDLRVHIGVDTALGIPAGPNSGLSVRLP